MKSKNLVFRADGNSEIGLGHLYRLFSLVEMLKSNYDFVFVTRESSLINIIPSSYPIQLIEKKVSIADEPNWLENNFSASDSILIADGYHFVSSYQKVIKEKGFKLIYIDDLATEYMFADIVVNHSPWIIPNDYKAERYTKFALGTSYAMLRPLFNDAAKKERKIKEIKNAFVCFGGADQHNLSSRAAKALLNINSIEKIHIVLGGAYKHENINLLESENNKIILHKNLSEKKLCELLMSCQIAIAPASTILYEICSIRMPVLSGYYVENQKNIYRGLADKNVIVKGGDFVNYTISDFENKILEILKSDKIDIYTENQHKLFRGNSRIVFLGMINRLNISFRKAEKEDVLNVFNWSNDSLVRGNSYDSNPIKLEEHKNWFLKKIKDQNTLFLIALVNTKPAGIVRFEISNKESVIGVLVSKDHRGQRLASEFLIQSAEKYFETYRQPILAYIKKDNKASLIAFKNSGYEYVKDEIINEYISSIYKLEKKDVKE